jgi:hypothetical protein
MDRHGFHEASSLRAAAAVPGVTLPCAIADADVERGEPCVDAKAQLFDGSGHADFYRGEGSARCVQGDRVGRTEERWISRGAFGQRGLSSVLLDS